MATFTYVSTRKSWPDARDDCTARGLQLAIVQDASEHTALAGLLSSRACRSAWIGASDSYIDGRWHWMDGSLLANDSSYTHWGPGQPADPGNEDCLLMQGLQHRGGQPGALLHRLTDSDPLVRYWMRRWKSRPPINLQPLLP